MKPYRKYETLDGNMTPYTFCTKPFALYPICSLHDIALNGFTFNGTSVPGNPVGLLKGSLSPYSLGGASAQPRPPTRHRDNK